MLLITQDTVTLIVCCVILSFNRHTRLQIKHGIQLEGLSKATQLLTEVAIVQSRCKLRPFKYKSKYITA